MPWWGQWSENNNLTFKCLTWLKVLEKVKYFKNLVQLCADLYVKTLWRLHVLRDVQTLVSTHRAHEVRQRLFILTEPLQLETDAHVTTGSSDNVSSILSLNATQGQIIPLQCFLCKAFISNPNKIKSDDVFTSSLLAWAEFVSIWPNLLGLKSASIEPS